MSVVQLIFSSCLSEKEWKTKFRYLLWYNANYLRIFQQRQQRERKAAQTAANREVLSKTQKNRER